MVWLKREDGTAEMYNHTGGYHETGLARSPMVRANVCKPRYPLTTTTQTESQQMRLSPQCKLPTVLVIRDTRDCKRDYEMHEALAKVLFAEGKLNWDATNGAYCEVQS